jgi:uncharacterized protein
MPRPRKWRKVCCMPRVDAFAPVGAPNTNELVTMSVDEYEIIRLIDLEGLSQDESAERMDVARSTVQRTYNDARKKLADFLINGKALRIEGGDYRLCDGNAQEQHGCHGRCNRHGCQTNFKLGDNDENKS